MMDVFPVRLYVMKTKEMEDPRKHPEWETMLAGSRWKKAISSVQVADRKNSAGAGWLLRYVFREEGVPFSADAIWYGPHGKPYHAALHFNLSHSGEYVICAVGKRNIGCDIQKKKACQTAMVRRFFSKEEQDYIFAVQGDKRDERFIKIWSRKESLLKMTGEGLSRDLRQISCVSSEGFFDWSLDDYLLSVCCERPQDVRADHVSIEYVNARQVILGC